MKLKPKERNAMRHLLQHAIRIRNHEQENPDHYGDEHKDSLARYRREWKALDTEQRVDAVHELQRVREDQIAASDSHDTSGVADLNDEAIKSIIAYLEGEG
jgi:hypothetical protein